MSTNPYGKSIFCRYADAYGSSDSYRHISDFVYIWGFFKNASLRWCLNTGEEVLRELGFNIIDGAANANIHVMGRRRNPDVFADIVCTRLGENPTSVVVHVISADETSARINSEQIRDRIKRTHSLEGDVVLNPVNE